MAQVGGSKAYIAAHAIAVQRRIMPFEDAYVLSRLVFEFGGGPCPVGRRSLMGLPLARQFVKQGLIELVGTADFTQPVVRRYVSDHALAEQLGLDSPIARATFDRGPARVRNEWWAEITREGLQLVVGSGIHPPAD